MKIDDAIRQLEELRRLYGNLPVRLQLPCQHESGFHGLECFDEASIEIREQPGFYTRMVVID